MSSRAAFSVLVLASSLSFAGLGSAAVFAPTKFTDSADGVCNADCSLREAIQAANLAAGADVIELGAGTYQLSRAGAGEDANSTGDLDLTSQITINGLDARRTILDGGDLDRVLHLLSSAVVQLNDVTIQNGTAAGGGGILSRGILTMSRCQVQHNASPGGFGGGLNADISGSLFVLDSTFFDNSAVGGGGVVLGIDSEFHNTTFSANVSTSDFGGGLYVFSLTEVLLFNVTMTGNSALTGGGGLVAEGGTMVAAANSIFSGNTAPIGPECSGAIVSQGHNLLRNNTNCTGFTATGDRVGTAGSPLDALLGPLRNNGSGTDSHRPLPLSPTLDFGSPASLGDPGACLSVDQRGVPRPQGLVNVRCDIGAIEDDTLFANGFDSGDTSGWSGVVP